MDTRFSFDRSQLHGRHPEDSDMHNDMTDSPEGQLLGEALEKVDGLATLLDSAEEVSMHMAHNIESKRHDEREIKTPAHSDELSEETILEYFSAGRQVDAPAQLMQRAREILDQRNATPGRQAKRALADTKQHGTPTEQYLVLQYTLQLGRTEGATPDVLAELQDAIAELELQYGPSIRADLNSAKAAGGYGETAADASELRGAYRELVLDHPSVSQTLSHAIERFGNKDIARGLMQLTLALGHDIAAARPSADKVHLELLIKEMQLVKTAHLVLEDTGTLLERCGKPDHQKKKVPLMKDVVGLCDDAWVSGDQFSKLGQTYARDDAPSRAEFQSGMFKMVSKLPERIFADDETRLRTIDAAQQAVDFAADEESML